MVILCLFLAAACLFESTTVISQKITEFDLVETQRLVDLEISKFSLLHLHEQKVEALEMENILGLARKLADDKLLHHEAHFYSFGFLAGFLVGLY